MHTDDRAVDHLDLAVVGFGNSLQKLVPDACLSPPDEPIVTRRVGAIPLRNVRPRRTRSEPPENAIQHPTIVDAGHSARLAWQQRIDDLPLGIGEFVATKLCHPNLHGWQCESLFAPFGNPVYEFVT
jgi:hypothetical protein